MNYLSLAFMLTLSIFVLPFQAQASGGQHKNSSPSVNQYYEDGKAIYKGRKYGSRRIAYCVNVDGEKKKIRARHLRSFVGGTATKLSANLYDCDAPNTLISQNISPDDFNAVLHYLDARYALKLH